MAQQAKPYSGESVVELAGRLYGSWSVGISDLLNSNPGIDINSVDLFGSSILYNDSLVSKKSQRPASFFNIERESLFHAHKLQSHFDLSIQIYGDFSKIGEILKNIDDINGEIQLGTSFAVPASTDPQAAFFLDKIVATDIIFDAPIPLTVDTVLIRVDSVLVTSDQTIY